MTYRSELWWKCQLHGITQSEALIPEDDLPTLVSGRFIAPDPVVLIAFDVS